MPQTGRPVMKERVPSIGSSTQTKSGVGALRPVLLADDAVLGIGRRDQLPHRGLGIAVGGRDGIEMGGGLVGRLRCLPENEA